MTPRQLDAVRSRNDAEYKIGEPLLPPLYCGDWGPDPIVTSLSLPEAQRLTGIFRAHR